MNEQTTSNEDKKDNDNDIEINDKQPKSTMDIDSNQETKNEENDNDNANKMDIDKDKDNDNKNEIEKDGNTSKNTRKRRHHKMKERDESQSEQSEAENEDEINKMPTFPVGKELKLNALKRVFIGTNKKFIENNNKNTNNSNNDGEPSEPAEPLYCVCRKTYQEDDFMIMCDLCEEWYHGYCIDIQEDDAEDIEEYDCFLCCGYRIPSKGVSYDKLDSRNTINDRFKLAKKNRETLAQQIQIETPTQTLTTTTTTTHTNPTHTNPIPISPIKITKNPIKQPQTKQNPKRKPMAKPAPLKLQIEPDTNLNIIPKKTIKAPLSSNVNTNSTRRAVRRPKELPQKRSREKFENTDTHSTGMKVMKPARKKQKLQPRKTFRGPPPPLQPVPPLEMPNLNTTSKTIAPIVARPSVVVKPTVKRPHENYVPPHMRGRYKYGSDSPYKRPPSTGHAPPPLPSKQMGMSSHPHPHSHSHSPRSREIFRRERERKRVKKKNIVRRQLSPNEWRSKIRDKVSLTFKAKMGVIKGKELENYLFSTYGGGSKVWTGGVLQHIAHFRAIPSNKRKQSAHFDGNMYVNKMYDFLDKIEEYYEILRIIKIGGIQAKDILYIGDNKIREAIRKSDPNYKMLSKLTDLLKKKSKNSKNSNNNNTSNDYDDDDGDIKLAENIISAAKKWSHNDKKQYVNKMRDLMYNLKKNDKLLGNVISGDLSPKNLVHATSDQLANDQILNKRKEIQENTLKYRVLTENLDKLKRDSYHIEKSKILNFEVKKSNNFETDYDITTDVVLDTNSKPKNNKKTHKNNKKKKKNKEELDLSEGTETSEWSDDSDDDLVIAANLKKKKQLKEAKKKEIGKLLAMASVSKSNTNSMSPDKENENQIESEKHKIIIMRDNDDDDSDDDLAVDEDDDIHQVKVIGNDEDDADNDNDDDLDFNSIFNNNNNNNNNNDTKMDDMDADDSDDNQGKKVVSFALDRNEIKIQSDHDITDENEPEEEDDHEVQNNNNDNNNMSEHQHQHQDDNGKMIGEIENCEIIDITEHKDNDKDKDNENENDVSSRENDIKMIDVSGGHRHENETVNEIHLIWKGKINHNEPVEENEDSETRTFGIKVYQIGGAFIYKLPGFESLIENKNKKKHKNKNVMLMTGRIEHYELEKYLIKSFKKNKINETRKLICCKITISKEPNEAQKLIKHLKLKERCARFKIGNKNKKNYFDFYIIPPTKNNKHLNYKFVETYFNAKISNKKMWGVIVLPMNSFNKVNKKQKELLIQKQKQKQLRLQNNNNNNNNSAIADSPTSNINGPGDNNNVLDDKFFSNLDGLASLLGVDQNDNNNNNIPSDPRKRRLV